ncbi:NAD-dependent epimerase/dehydratase family protein [Candidatus Nitrospira bockiana]
MDPLTLDRKAHVLVTGGAGFIGSHLCTRLLADGLRVTIGTRHLDSPRARALAAAGAQLVPWDAARAGDQPLDRTGARADVLIHLAADVSVDGPGLKATNVEGTRRMLDLAERLRVSYVIYASSIEAQGPAGDQENPLTETQPCRPVSPYGKTKLDGETLVDQWATSDRQVLIVRLGNIYGPGSPWLIEPCLTALLGATPLAPVWPALAPRRLQPLYVADLVEALLRAIGVRLTGLHNMTGQESVTVHGYLDRLARLTGLSHQLERIEHSAHEEAPRPVGLAPDFAYLLLGGPDRSHRVYDNTKLERAIGPYGRWPLLRGLAASLRWYEESGRLPALVTHLRTGAFACT